LDGKRGGLEQEAVHAMTWRRNVSQGMGLR